MENLRCHGRSISLDVDSNPGADTALLRLLVDRVPDRQCA
jgi:hypothetical protein